MQLQRLSYSGENRKMEVPWVFPHQVLSLPERGGKHRIVTKSPASLLGLLHTYR